MRQSVGQSVGQSVRQSVGQSVGRSVGRSGGRSHSHYFLCSPKMVLFKSNLCANYFSKFHVLNLMGSQKNWKIMIR